MKLLAMNPIDILLADPSNDTITPTGQGTPNKPSRNLDRGIGGIAGRNSIINNLNKSLEPSPIPFRSNMTSSNATNITVPIVINNQDGSQTRTEKYFSIMA